MDNVSRATSNVFVTNYQERDFGPADELGECIFITRAFVPLNNISALYTKLANHVAYSKPSDFAILTGPSVLIAIFTALWLQKHGFMNILSWNTRSKTYKHYVVSSSQILDGNS